MGVRIEEKMTLKRKEKKEGKGKEGNRKKDGKVKEGKKRRKEGIQGKGKDIQ